MIVTKTITLSTKGRCDIHNITDNLRSLVDSSGINTGTVTVFVPGSTGGLTTLEYEPGLLSDLPDLMEKLIPSDVEYKHDQTWHDGNGFSHLRATIIGPDITIPLVSGRLTLGAWQQVVFLCFDNRGRNRELIVQIMGD